MSRALSGLALCVCVGCRAPHPLNPSRMTGEAEALAGSLAAPAVEHRFGGVLRDAQAEDRMARIGRRLASCAEYPPGGYRFRLLAAEQPNAISLPGGLVYVTRGLYARLGRDELLAAALAHEIAHVAFRDGLKPRCRNLDESLARELAADAHAARYLEAAGLPPAALIELVLLIEDAQPCGWADARARNLARQLRDSDIPPVVDAERTGRRLARRLR